jgi:hypothetical protein
MIADLIGPAAQMKWHTLTDERKNTVLRYLFRAVIIGAHDSSMHPDTIDFGRIDIEENELA